MNLKLTKAGKEAASQERKEKTEILPIHIVLEAVQETKLQEDLVIGKMSAFLDLAEITQMIKMKMEVAVEEDGLAEERAADANQGEGEDQVLFLSKKIH